MTSATPSSTGGEDAAPGSVPSILDPRVCGGSHDGLLAVYSLSKQSNVAGYRAAFVAGDPALVRRLLEIRKHAGMIVPWPVQQAMVAALGDDAHVAQQKERYRRRRACCGRRWRAPASASTTPTPGLYLWATRGEDAWATIAGSPSAASSRRPAASTARPARGTCGSRSPRPTSGSRPPLPAAVPMSGHQGVFRGTVRLR